MLLAHLRGLLKPTEPSTHAALFAELQMFRALDMQEAGNTILQGSGLSRNLAASTSDKSLFKQVTSDYNRAILQGSNYRKLIPGTVQVKTKSLGVDDLVEVYKILTKHGVH